MQTPVIDLKTARNRRTPNPDQIIIAGAGIAGLTLALALSARGFAVQIFEKSAVLAEAGAGIQLSPNATRLLQRLGVLDRLMPASVQPDAVCLQDGISGNTLLHLPMGKGAEERWHSPYIVCHRADLQRALLAEVRSRDNIAMQLESSVTHHRSDSQGVMVRVQYNDRIEEHHGALLVGADGVWSILRNAASDHDQARYTGSIAWRASVPISRLPASFTALLPEGKNVVAWTGSNAHLIAYPMRSGEMMNFVAVARDRKSGGRWDVEISPDAPSQNFAKDFYAWHPGIRDLVLSVGPWTPWRLFEMKRCHFLQDNRLVLIGDAAHAMTPYAAQGAAMAIEDACALAATLGEQKENWPRELAAYAKSRTRRIESVIRRGALNQLAYHAKGPVALARNLLMRNRPVEKFVAGFDWLYGFDAESK
ncbi:FAD-dependent monooxygenase [Phyllobacterium sp. P30BS-XVII]|uniref:FAD-dependent monooxygenase n=1 Tax=Phyllobacterium sp. P30BS-XVII TaxID=2587046 RepID=UPI000DD782E2|nr:FAD-dependent monooxygenase [Phyllobacterium sp. P30BS-XVII]MBA8901049.1 salicylate hydroxylase [Phyllobacterium sp. P30BS-XVII]